MGWAGDDIRREFSVQSPCLEQQPDDPWTQRVVPFEISDDLYSGRRPLMTLPDVAEYEIGDRRSISRTEFREDCTQHYRMIVGVELV